MIHLITVLIVFLAATQQAISGFGFALIIMPLLTLTLGLHTSAPLVALAGLTIYLVNLVRYRHSLNLREVARLCGASLLGIPVGIWALKALDEATVRTILGIILAAYALYCLTAPRLPYLRSGWWVYPMGFVAGCLGGAYNTPGPPVILYASMRQWPREKFKAMLQAFFFLNAALVSITHLVYRHMTPLVWQSYLFAVPAILLGIWVGARLDHRIDATLFRKLVQAMILVLGLSLILA